VEYQDQLGGFLRPALPAPGFERAWDLMTSFESATGIEVRCGVTAVGLIPASDSDGGHTLIIRARTGTEYILARRIVLACGGLEITREQDEVPGTRPAGIMTPVLAHQLLSLGYLPGRRAVVYGRSRYTNITALRLVRAGVEVTLVPAPGHNPPSVAGGIHTEPPAELAEIGGFPRVEWIALRRDGILLRRQADTLVYASGLMPNTSWLKGSGVTMTTHRAIAVNERWQTSVPGVYAIGTCVHPSLDHADSIMLGESAAKVVIRGGS